MLREVRFFNFKAFRHASLELGRLSVVVGPNASGKTSLLEGIHYLCQLCGKTDADKVFSGPRDPSNLRTRDSDEPMTLLMLVDDGQLRYEWKGPDNETIIEPEGSLAHLAAFSSAVYLHLDVSKLGSASYIEQPVPRVEFDGYGLATVLAHLALNEPESFDRLQDEIAQVIPPFRKIRFERARLTRQETQTISVDGHSQAYSVEREYWGDRILIDMAGATKLSTQLVSEGTLIVIGLLTVLNGPVKPRVVLLDDIERALHPLAQRKLVELLRDVIDRNPQMQIVATSHSPYLLDCLAEEEVRLTTLNGDGAAQCGRLCKHPDFQQWKDTMAPGELWSYFGERFIAEPERQGSETDGG